MKLVKFGTGPWIFLITLILILIVAPSTYFYQHKVLVDNSIEELNTVVGAVDVYLARAQEELDLIHQALAPVRSIEEIQQILEEVETGFFSSLYWSPSLGMLGDSTGTDVIFSSGEYVQEMTVPLHEGLLTAELPFSRICTDLRGNTQVAHDIVILDHGGNSLLDTTLTYHVLGEVVPLDQGVKKKDIISGGKESLLFLRSVSEDLYVGLSIPRTYVMKQVLTPVIIHSSIIVLVFITFWVYSKQLRKNLRLQFMVDNAARFQETETFITLGKLAAGLAHEVKNPLTVAKGYLQLMESDPDRYMNPMTVRTINTEMERIQTVLMEYLDLGRQGDGAKSEVDVNHLLKSVTDIMAVYSREVGFQVDLSDIPEVFGDEGKLRQVFVNLLKNAVEASPPGEDVYVTTLSAMEKVQIIIRDMGKGIQPEHLEVLGTPFFTTKESGTGMGLAVSYQVIEEHGGNITVDSQVGFGATFVVELPSGA